MKIRKNIINPCRIFLAFFFIGLGSLVYASVEPMDVADKARLIVITDIGTEPDDVQSVIRLLTYANDIDIEGLIAAPSKHLRDEVHPEFIEKRIIAYGEVLSNLRVHDKSYPAAEQLLKVVRAADPIYGLEGVKKGAHEHASKLIIEAVDKDDSRPVWVSIWGGAAPLAAALSKIQNSRTQEQVDSFISKLRVYSISDQDDTGPWMRMQFPQLFWVSSMHAMGEYSLSTWTGITSAAPGANQKVINNQWIHENIQQKGKLGRLYPSSMFGMEGDSPSFLYLIPNGLGNPEYPNWGSWGGRYSKIADFLGLWTDTTDTVKGIDNENHLSNAATVWRWREAFQNDFAARLNWTVTNEFNRANHPPSPIINEMGGYKPLILNACAGEKIQLSAKGSNDIDNDNLEFHWSFYREVTGIYSPSLNISETDGEETIINIPVWQQPFKIELPDFYEFHILLAVTDSGNPALTRYKRTIIKVPTNGHNGCEKIVKGPKPTPTDFVRPLIDAKARFSINSKIGDLMDNPDAKAVLAKHLPKLIHSMQSSPQARALTVSAIAHFSPSITDDVILLINQELSAIQ
jgi:hypothetical protein